MSERRGDEGNQPWASSWSEVQQGRAYEEGPACLWFIGSLSLIWGERGGPGRPREKV